MAATIFPTPLSGIQETKLTTTGDTLYASAANTAARLGIGSTGQVLTVASGLPSWATPATPAVAGARVYKSTSQAFTPNTFAEVSWDLEVFDTDGFHSNVTNNNRFTIPSGKAGYYRIEYSVGPYNTTENYFKFMKNGSMVEQGDYAQPSGTTGNLYFSYIANLAVADYVSFQYQQSTASNKNIQATGVTYAQIQYLGA
jgi:hypothetical protein